MATKTEVDILKAFLGDHGPIASSENERLCYVGDFTNHLFRLEEQWREGCWSQSDGFASVGTALSIAERWLERAIMKVEGYRSHTIISENFGEPIWRVTVFYGNGKEPKEVWKQAPTKLEALIAAFQELQGE